MTQPTTREEWLAIPIGEYFQECNPGYMLAVNGVYPVSIYKKLRNPTAEETEAPLPASDLSVLIAMFWPKEEKEKV